MKTIKYFISVVVLSFVMIGFSQCSSTKKTQTEASIDTEKVYFQKWIAGIRGGGAGLNIFIPVTDKTVLLDSVYFRGKAVKLKLKPQDENVYIGEFISKLNKKQDITMSNDPKAEYGNKRPIVQEKIPFELKKNECMISYKKGSKTKYFKVDNVVEKELIAFPSAKPKN